MGFRQTAFLVAPNSFLPSGLFVRTFQHPRTQGGEAAVDLGPLGPRERGVRLPGERSVQSSQAVEGTELARL